MIESDQFISLQEVVLEHIKEPIYALDQSYKIVVWNRAIAELTGILPNKAIGQSFDDLFSFQNKDVRKKIGCGETFMGFAIANTLEFRTLIEPMLHKGNTIGYRGGLYIINDGVLRALPQEYLVGVINESPISTIVFNLDGSIMFSNNAYRSMWKLGEKDLAFVNKKYNVFLDRQLEAQGLMPFIKSAFKGETQQAPVFNYSFKSSTLGRTDNQEVNCLLAHTFPIRDKTRDIVYIVLTFTDVTKLENLERAFEENKDRLQLALEGGDLGTWDWDITANKVTYNERWANMLGFNLEEVYELKWKNLLHPDDKEEAVRKLNDLIEGKIENYESEFRLKTKDGSWHWILDRGKVVEWDSSSNPTRIAGTHIDINERRINEEKLRTNEAKYRRLIENAPVGIGIIADEKVVFINEELARIGGVKDKDSVMGAPANLFVPEGEKYDVFMDRYRMVIEKGENAPLYTTQLRSVDGELVDVEVASIPANHEGKPAMQVLINDITERKKALTDLARSREQLNQLFENSPMGMVLLDDQFKVSKINKGFVQIFEYTFNELEGNSLLDFILPTELKEEAKSLNTSALRGEIKCLETYRINKTGAKIPVIIYALPIIEAGKHIGVYGIYVDIGQRVKAEEELKTRNLELDNFVYKVSHDLRAPLASILGLINLTKLEDSREDQDYYVELMEGQVNKLDHFIRDILSHSKNLKMSVSSDKINFHEIVQQCFDDLGYLKAATKVKRIISIDDQEFKSDKWRISEIFRNLIGNSIKYRNPDTEENIIEVKVEIDDNGCNIEVSDNGMGIAKDKIPHVMEMFYRGTESSDGSGIGLYIVQKAVEKIAGKISLESEVNIGTKFNIWLPSLKS